VFFLQVTVIGTIGREEKRGRSQFWPAAFRWRVSPRAASDGGAWEDAPVAEGFPCNFWSLGTIL